MVITTINVENDVRRRYNRRVLFCIRIKGAAILIGLWDLFIHLAALCALIFMFGRTSRTITDLTPIDDEFSRQIPSPFVDPYHDSSSHIILNNKEFRSSNILLNRILEKRNATYPPPMDINARNFYANMDLMTIKWAQSLSQQDKCVVFFVVFSATVLILVHICGVLGNKASYVVPYFLIKVVNVIISILSMLGFYTYLPDISTWLRMQPEFPFKNYLLELDGQTLQLIIFTFLLFIILAKLYIAAIIWYCYGYITALNMARAIGTITTHSDCPQSILGEMYSPPKYEEAIKLNSQHQEDYAPPPYTPLLSA
ncbi:unnamed protein product [Adineta steineri]|uniref:Lysosomal-associated transmembrane protein 4A n=2 Tax=Adineta steineri TaxID=433720 RepID=A0A815CMZ5_9BILA|nr:unnamed protein product [Adineta steineri]CAF3575232.1 unnamed protein product [Adineta steineri]